MSFIDFTLGKISEAEFVAQFPKHLKLECWAPGVLYLPGESQFSLVLSAGIHGNETAPVLVLNEIVARIIGQVLTPKHACLFILGHPQALAKAVRYCDTNLNRLFCGQHLRVAACIESMRAALLELCVARFFQLHDAKQKLHWDCHCAIRDSFYRRFAVVPVAKSPCIDITHRPLSSQLNKLQQAGIQAAVLSQLATNTFSYASYIQYGAQAATLELGKALPWAQNNMLDHQIFQDYLISLLSLDEVKGEAEVSHELQLFTIAQQINKYHDDFMLAFAADAANFSCFQQGEVLAKEAEKEYCVQANQEWILFPNAKVENGARALLTLTPYVS
ncbi:succinylglutamate desuccinylase [Motilimonas sp. KMU-193]|uniref:succinylglutamate desuccinylase n=1 Tax=Motilimonas sp. KMU-193 TaxID=3388668 RepID=UPI00396AF5F9